MAGVVRAIKHVKEEVARCPSIIYHAKRLLIKLSFRQYQVQTDLVTLMTKVIVYIQPYKSRTCTYQFQLVRALDTMSSPTYSYPPQFLQPNSKCDSDICVLSATNTHTLVHKATNILFISPRIPLTRVNTEQSVSLINLQLSAVTAFIPISITFHLIYHATTLVYIFDLTVHIFFIQTSPSLKHAHTI